MFFIFYFCTLPTSYGLRVLTDWMHVRPASTECLYWLHVLTAYTACMDWLLCTACVLRCVRPVDKRSRTQMQLNSLLNRRLEWTSKDTTLFAELNEEEILMKVYPWNEITEDTTLHNPTNPTYPTNPTNPPHPTNPANPTHPTNLTNHRCRRWVLKRF